MKKLASLFLCCVLIVMCFTFSGFASKNPLNERIDFVFENRVFSYNLVENIKRNKQFDINNSINRYGVFSSKVKRKNLLKKMLTIGIEKSVATEYLFPNLQKTVKKLEKNVNIAAKNAKLDVNPNSKNVFSITNEVVGRCLNTQKLYDDLINAYLNDNNLTIQINTIKILPEITNLHYRKFTNLRADFSTDISSSSADRKHNIKNALNSLNMLEIAPNEVFSFNKTVGRRTEENGYRQAKIIVNNEFVEGLGGGVCQVSSTLYNAALLAGCEILEANKHSKQVGYVKYGFDAMVNFGSSDLKFRNTTNEKLTIVANYSPTKARIRIFGEDMGEISYKLSNEIISVIKADYEIEFDSAHEHTDKVFFQDEFFILKPAVDGIAIKSFRDKYVSGTLTEHKQLRFDKFKAQNGIKVYGTTPRLTSDYGI